MEKHRQDDAAGLLFFFINRESVYVTAMAQVPQMLMHETLLMQINPLNSIRLSTVRKLSLYTGVYRMEANIICELVSLLRREEQWCC